MSKRITLSLAAVLAVSMFSAAPAIAGFAVQLGGQPCTVGQTNCVQDDPDDAAKGHTVIPTGQTTRSSTNGDTGTVTTTTGPTPAPTPAPGPD